MAALGKKKKAKDDERINALDNARKQHNYHIGRLEQMLRLLDNNDLAPDQVRDLNSRFFMFPFVFGKRKRRQGKGKGKNRSGENRTEDIRRENRRAGRCSGIVLVCITVLYFL